MGTDYSGACGPFALRVALRAASPWLPTLKASEKMPHKWRGRGDGAYIFLGN
jgi:hypothetical protein